jgi:phosphatidylserine/phosphatidylglycerophosphate/cardiolipin synthase-like enzyme
MFNNGHIGHNKFAVYVGAGEVPKAVLTGSTNWTPTGLCGQSNNAVIIESVELARQYFEYWLQLRNETLTFKKPAPPYAPTKNVQGASLRSSNGAPLPSVTLGDNTVVSLWRAPNTVLTTKKGVLPPDLRDVFSRMQEAENVILFAAFYPSQTGKDSVIEKAVLLGTRKPSLMVYGSVSDPKALPNYVPSPKGSQKIPNDMQPAVFEKGNTHIVRAANLGKDDIVGDFETELLKVGNAVIHDKIVVVDPLSKKGFVVTGSHNLGFKASYENDENLLIIENNERLVQAYAVHLIDLYEHYRFRAVQKEIRESNKKATRWDGFLSVDAKWLQDWKESYKGGLARYFAQ